VIDRDLFLGYRIVMVRIGLVVSWAALGGYLWLANDGPGSPPDHAVEALSLLAGVLALLTITPWRRVLHSEFGDAYIGIWAAVAVGGLVSAHEIGSVVPVAAAFLAVIVFATATLVRPAYLLVVAVAAIAGYAVTADRAGIDLGKGAGAVGLGAFVLAGIFAMAASLGVGRVFFTAARRLARLQRESSEMELRREELDELYAVSAAIGLGGTLTEIVPIIMSRIVESVEARVGLVFLFRPDRDDLELISPLWVSGRTVRAEGYALPLTEAGVVQKVFTSGEPLVSNEPVTSADEEPLLTDLETSKLAAVPMAVDGRPIGVLVVADKSDGDFGDADIERLRSLAGPAALVMNQMARYDAAREERQKMAEVAQLKSDFVSIVSHELRSPLTSIIGSLRTLLRPDLKLESAAATELIATAARQADRLRALIEDLLVASRIDSDALPVRPEATLIAPLVEELLDDLAAADDRVTKEIPIDLPDVQIDPDHLRRILRNLVENALKYSGGSDIEVLAKRSGQQVWLSVVDHGPGIPYELHDHIFQRFTQAQHHETRAQGGTGLGLSIVRGLTEAMGGRVWFEPTVGGGATFTVALPVRSGAKRQVS
jgi:two-component system sensor histidine kinase KdpD